MNRLKKIWSHKQNKNAINTTAIGGDIIEEHTNISYLPINLSSSSKIPNLGDSAIIENTEISNEFIETLPALSSISNEGTSLALQGKEIIVSVPNSVPSTVPNTVSVARLSRASSINNKRLSQLNFQSKKGFLKRKKIGPWGSYIDSWFILDSLFLMEYKSSNETEKPRKVINLTRCSLKYTTEIQGYPNAFALLLSDQHSLVLQASDETQLVEWIVALRNVCAESEIEWKTESILDAFNDGIIVTSDKGMILQVNDHLLSTLNYKRDDLIGLNVEFLFPSVYSDDNLYNSKNLSQFIGNSRRLEANKQDGSKVNVILSIGECTCNNIAKVVLTIKLENQFINYKFLQENIDRLVDSALQDITHDIKDKIKDKLQQLYDQSEFANSNQNKLLSKSESDNVINKEEIISEVKQSVLESIQNSGNQSTQAEVKFVPVIQTKSFPSFNPFAISQQALQYLPSYDSSSYLIKPIMGFLLILLVFIGIVQFVPRTRSVFAFNFGLIGIGFVLISYLIYYVLKEEKRIAQIQEPPKRTLF